MKTIINKLFSLVAIMTFSIAYLPTAFSEPMQQQDNNPKLPAAKPDKAPNKDIEQHLKAPKPATMPDLNGNILDRVAHAPGQFGEQLDKPGVKEVVALEVEKLPVMKKDVVLPIAIRIENPFDRIAHAPGQFGRIPAKLKLKKNAAALEV